MNWDEPQDALDEKLKRLSLEEGRGVEGVFHIWEFYFAPRSQCLYFRFKPADNGWHNSSGYGCADGSPFHVAHRIWSDFIVEFRFYLGYSDDLSRYESDVSPVPHRYVICRVEPRKADPLELLGAILQ